MALVITVDYNFIEHVVTRCFYVLLIFTIDEIIIKSLCYLPKHNSILIYAWF